MFLGLLYRQGANSEVGGETSNKLVAMHQALKITDVDQHRHFVVSIAFEPRRIGELLGRDVFSDKEIRAHFLFWREVGRRWNLPIPEEQHELREWLNSYECKHFAPSQEAEALMAAMVDDFSQRFFPKPLQKAS